MPKLDNIIKELDYAINILFEQVGTKDRDNQLSNNDRKQSEHVRTI